MTRGKVMVLGLVACVCSAIVVSADAQSARKILAERTSDDRAVTLTVVDTPTADEVAPARAVRPARGGGVAGGCAADILSADPEDLTEDARQPHDPGSGQDEDPALRQGIGSVDEPITLVLSAAGLADDCFALSETTADAVLGANGIATVTEGPAATYTIVLNHAIAPGAVTTIAVGGDSVAYLAHPSNTNHDDFSNANDVLSTIDMLNGVVPPPFGIYSTDVDHSGAFGAADVLRVIDLLNGAIPYIVWLGVEKPEFPVGAVCGNGVVEEGEECDPPDGVTCDDSCQTIDPGCGDGGDCCIGNGTPGCDNGDCCDCICGLDPFCCDISWDGSCGDNAVLFCTVCGGTPPAECGGPVVCGEGDCCDPDGTGTPGCSDQDCCDCICSNDTFCCDFEWDAQCAAAAANFCEICGGNPDGCGDPCPPEDCEACCCPDGTDCFDLPTFDCQALGCLNQGNAGDGNTCAVIESCQGDTAACTPAAGDCCKANGSVGCNVIACCECVCAFDAFCCDTNWDDLCVGDTTTPQCINECPCG